MTDMFLDIVGIVVGCTQAAYAWAALWLGTGHRATLAGLTKSTQRWWTATALAGLGVVINLVSIPFDGWTAVLAPLFALATALAAAVVTSKRRDRKAEEVWRS